MHTRLVHRIGTLALAAALGFSGVGATGLHAAASPTPGPSSPAETAAPAETRPPAAPRAAHEPIFDDLQSTYVIPDIPGVEYLVNGVVTAAGTTKLTVPFKGTKVTITARSTTGGPAPTPSTWTHLFPEVITPVAPTWDDARTGVRTPSRAGVQYFAEGANDGKPLLAGSFTDLSAFAGRTVKVYAKAPVPTVTLLTGTTEWLHTFPAKAAAPTFDNAASTITIPTTPGVEYLVDGVVTPAGVVQLTVPFRGLKVEVTARSTVPGGPAPTPAFWTNTFPEVVTPPAPTWNDARIGVQVPSRAGIEYRIDGANDGNRLPAGSYFDLTAFEGKTVRMVASTPYPNATLIVGTREWTHTFAMRPPAPTFDDRASTIQIPSVPGVEYLVDGVPVPAGPHQLPTVPFKGTKVTVTVRAAEGAPEPTPATWTHTFPELVDLPKDALEFDPGRLRVRTFSRSGVLIKVEGRDKPLVASSWNDLSEFNGKTVRIYAEASTAVTLLVGETEWFYTFPDRPTYPLPTGDEFDGPGVSTAWRVYSEAKPSKGKSVSRAENATVHDGVLDLRTSRHCIKADGELLTDANKTEAVCPAGTLTRYSTARLDTNYIYGVPKSMKVRAKLDVDHRGITSTAWMHNDEPFCSATVKDSSIAEMDVMEMWHTDYSQSFSHITCEGGKYHTYGVKTTKPMTGEWHEWSVEWDGYVLRYYLDGELQSGPAGPLVTADLLNISQDRFTSAMNDNQWQLVINTNAPPDGSWAPWIDDTLPFRDRHDLYDYVRIEPFLTKGCAATGAIGEYAAAHPELGAPVTCETDAKVPGGRVQVFEKGRVYTSAATGTHGVTGPVLDRFMMVGAESELGLPTGPGIDIRDGGRSQAFASGTVFWSQATGAHVVRGRILVKYAELGWENSSLGYPVTGELCGLRDGGCVQRFQGKNGHIYWSPATDAHFIHGAIFDRYAAMGWENGPFGYPVSDEFCGLRDGGCGQRFQHESGHIYWAPATGTHSIQGLIYERFAAMGWENGAFGYPISDEICGLRDSGCVQRFQRESGHIYWSAASGAHSIQGLVYQRYAAMGWENSAIGYPISDEVCGIRDGGCFQRFQHESGHIYWSPATGSWGVQGAIFGHYAANRWETGRFGYATGPEVCSGDGPTRECRQNFQGGQITWSAWAGVRG